MAFTSVETCASAGGQAIGPESEDRHAWGGGTVPALKVIDLFCGAGGLSEGFRQAGYNVLAGNDADRAAGETFKLTHPKATFLPGPIQNHTTKSILSTTGLKKGELDVLVGGPPCQGFSVYNHQRGLHDKRSSLYLEYLRIVSGLDPKWIVLENVTGMTSAGGGEAVAAITKGLLRLGYAVDCQILKAEQYGVPQERRRLLFIGNRVGAPIIWPEPTHGPDLIPYTTVRDALSDLPILGNGEAQSSLYYRHAPSGFYQTEMRRRAPTELQNHSAARLAPINLKRMEHIPPGGSWRDIPFELLPAGMKKAKRSDHTKRYGRLKWNGLSSTILTKCDPHWGAYFHPQQNRTITVREAARLQSFPDWFVFQGSRTEQYIQVGNAVPPLLGRRIAEVIRASLEMKKRTPVLAAAE